MRYKYEFEVNEWFEKGDCYDCPLGYQGENWEFCCVLHKHPEACPLKEVEN